MNAIPSPSLNRRAGVDISVIVPVGPRHVDMRALHAEYRASLQKTGRNVEYIYVVDGHFEDVTTSISQLVADGEPVIGVYLTRTFGESTALMAGFEQASGDVIVTLPAYRQIEADDIGKILAALGPAD